MGPRTYIRGNLPQCYMNSGRICCFNGAADLHPRKYWQGVVDDWNNFVASMGPRTYIRGNGVLGQYLYQVYTVLQWGRGLTSAEIRQ